MQEQCDVVVVGASLAGPCASLFSSFGGIDTILVEKKNIIGTPVKCGEFIPTLESMKKLLPKAMYVEKIYSLIPPETISNRTRSIQLYSPSNRCFEFKFDGLVLRRDLLEQHIVRKAEENGARLYISSVVKTLKVNEKFRKIVVKGPDGEKVVRAKIVVGADGFPSRIATWASMENSYRFSDISLTIQNTMANVDVEESSVEMYTGNKYAPGAYAWIIPKGEKIANVGLGVRLSCFRTSERMPIRSIFEKFLKEHPVASKKLSKAKPLSFSAKMVPAGGMVKELYKNNVILVGDAAGLVLPINGSGIPTAMISGCIAGEVASKCIHSNSELDLYEEKLKRELDPIINLSLAYRRIADRFMYSDRRYSAALRFIGALGLSRILKCEKTTLGTIFQKFLAS